MYLIDPPNRYYSGPDDVQAIDLLPGSYQSTVSQALLRDQWNLVTDCSRSTFLIRWQSVAYFVVIFGT